MQSSEGELIIVTKYCGLTREENESETLAIKNPESTVDYINKRGLSRQTIFSAVNASLGRLNIEHIDLLRIASQTASCPWYHDAVLEAFCVTRSGRRDQGRAEELEDRKGWGWVISHWHG
jgi:aryl-alcohol dehydrogenase-like predicted oxidoreductase